jgi:hypothetical protein
MHKNLKHIYKFYVVMHNKDLLKAITSECKKHENKLEYINLDDLDTLCRDLAGRKNNDKCDPIYIIIEDTQIGKRYSWSPNIKSVMKRFRAYQVCLNFSFSLTFPIGLLYFNYKRNV